MKKKFEVVCPTHGVIPSYMAVAHDPQLLAKIHIKMNRNCATVGVQVVEVVTEVLVEKRVVETITAYGEHD
jgi:hypothetical protein